MRSILTASAFIALSTATFAYAQVSPVAVPTLPPPTLPTPPPLPPLPTSVTVTLTVLGNEALGSFDIGGIGADLRVAFEKVVGLVPSALDVTASVVNPLDPALLARLPPDGSLGVPVAFPVVVRISPSAASALSFEGAYTVSFHTHNLHLDPAVSFSLLKSPNGGPFKDITKSEGRGSYRDDGSGGDFSDFLIAIDLRPIDSVISGKFDDLQALLTNNADVISPDTLANLQADLSHALTLYQSGATRDAVTAMADFTRDVREHEGADIPDVWRANCSPLINVAGLLRSGADTLRFSLDRKASR
jgi:hypothetical protein